MVFDIATTMGPAQADVIAESASLEFRPVVLDPTGQQEIFAGPGGPGEAGPALTPAAALGAPGAVDQTVVLPLDPKLTNGVVTERYVLGPVIRDGGYLFTGQLISTAQANVDTTGQSYVSVTFTGQGGSEWDKVVGERYYQHYIAIVLDHSVISAPQINSQHFGGSAQITGAFTQAQAQNLALVLRYGTLPARFGPAVAARFTSPNVRNWNPRSAGTVYSAHTVGDATLAARRLVAALAADRHASFAVRIVDDPGGPMVEVEVLNLADITNVVGKVAAALNVAPNEVTVNSFMPTAAPGS